MRQRTTADAAPAGVTGQWVEGLTAVVDHLQGAPWKLKSLRNGPRYQPGEKPGAGDLAALWELWLRLTQNEPAEVAASRLLAPVKHDQAKAEQYLGDALNSLESIMLELFRRGVTCEGVVRSWGFAEGAGFAFLTVPPSIPASWPSGLGVGCYAIGLIHTLPAGHRLRDLLPPDELYQADLGAGTAPGLVLGLALRSMAGAWRPRPLYPLAGVAALTRAARRQQRAAEAFREEARLERRRQEDEMHAARPEVQAQRLAVEVAQLKERLAAAEAK